MSDEDANDEILEAFTVNVDRDRSELHEKLELLLFDFNYTMSELYEFEEIWEDMNIKANNTFDL